MNLEFRKITIDDKTKIEEITKGIWEGTDYVPLLFDEWLNDDNGLFYGAIYNKELIGFQKITFVTPTDAWLEGLRKHPKCKLKGVGKAINTFMLNKLATKTDLTSIRFSTYFENYESISVFRKLGFEITGKRSIKSFELKNYIKGKICSDINLDNFQFCKIKEFKEISAFLKDSSYLESLNNNLNYAWKLYPTTRNSIEKHFLNKKNIFAVKEQDKVQALAFLSYAETGYLSFFDAKNKEAGNVLLENIIKYLKTKEFETLDFFVTEDDFIKEIIDKAEFKSWSEEDDFLIFEFPVSEFYNKYGKSN